MSNGIRLIGLGTIAISSTHRPPCLVISVPPLVSAPCLKLQISYQLRNRSSSSSLLSNFLCREASDIVRFVWYDPSPRSGCSSSCSRSLYSRLFFLCSCHVDPRGDPTEPLSIEPFDHLPDIFCLRVSAEPRLCRRSPQTAPIVRTPNKLKGSTCSWAHNIFLTWVLDFLLWAILT